MNNNQDENLATASPASSASDSDAFNTASARIHFGPFRSPEKKFVPTVVWHHTLYPGALNSTMPRSPVPAAGSPSHGTPERVDDGNEENQSDDEDDEDLNLSRSGTPENDRFPQDEPSSVLATKIIRAHDNPSPPPRNRHMTGSLITDLADLPLIDMSESPKPYPPIVDILSIDGTHEVQSNSLLAPIPFSLSNIPHSLRSTPSRDASPARSPHPHLAHNASQRDLISFDSFSIPPASLHSNIPAAYVSPSSAATSTTLPPSSDNLSIDQMLLRSPGPSRPVQYASTSEIAITRLTTPGVSIDSLLHFDDKGKGKARDGGTSECTDEQAVVNAISFPDAEDSSKSPSPAVPVILLPNYLEGQQEEEPEPPQTPPRRSTCPRRSGTPRSLQVTRVASNIDDAQLSATPLTGLLAPPSTSLTRNKRRKGKERAGSPRDEVVSDSESERSRGRSRSASADNGREESALKQAGEKMEARRRIKDRGEQKREREKSGQVVGTPGALQRELRSLSPGSANLLTQLLPSSKQSPVLELDIEATVETSQTRASPTTPQQPTFSFSLYPRPSGKRDPIPTTPIRFTSPVRFPSPVRFTAPISPSRPKLQPAALDDPNRTPARRIPIEQAVAHGQISAQKAAQLIGNSANMGMVARTPVFTIRKTDSPPKRVNISETPTSSGQGKWQGMRFGSPIRGISKDRSGSAEPRSSSGAPSGKTRARSGSVEPRPASSSSSGPVILGKLPFPLVPSGAGPDFQIPIPEENEREVVLSGAGISAGAKSTPVPISSPVKSSLKQPSSRIPRISVKPYARPATVTATKANGKTKESGLPSVMRKVDLTKVGDASKTALSKPQKIVRPGSGSGSSSDTNIINSTGLGPSSTSRIEVASSANLKRKRGTEKTSPSKSRPAVVMRQVVPDVVIQKSVSKPSTVQTDSSPPKKPQGPIKFRRVLDLGSQDQARPKELETEDVELPAVNGQDIIEQEVGIASVALPNAEVDAIPGSSLPMQEPSPASSRIAKDHTSLRSPAPTNETEEPPARVRRTTRPRKPAQSTSAADVFGQVDVRPLQPRRKANTQPSIRSEGNIFSGLSATALRALTSSNTVKNQKYLAAKLETEVIRKEGARPDSPTVKVKTVLQRQNEEKGQQRKERAARRARRGDDGSAGGQSDADGQSDRGDSSLIDGDWDDDRHDSNSYIRTHKRGPGDEEDYDTPDKLERPPKRLKFAENDEWKVREEKRRVKWDRGLSTMIYLDEVQPRTRAHLKEDVIKKGCLSKAAKALRLDTLGNLPNADSPLTDLVQEHVTVKKFVYDNDVEPVAEVIVVKNTRSRSRSRKS